MAKAAVISGTSKFPRPITGTTGMLNPSDNGNGIICTNAASVTITVPQGLGEFTCYIVQKGAGIVTLVESGTTINNWQGHTGTVGQYATIGLLATDADTYVLTGATA